MIKPTVGRVVLYNPLEEAGQNIRHAALIAEVHNDVLVNLACFDSNGVPYHRQNVTLIQDSIVEPLNGQCEWMPYQHGQAAKYDTGLDNVLKRLAMLEQTVGYMDDPDIRAVRNERDEGMTTVSELIQPETDDVVAEEPIVNVESAAILGLKAHAREVCLISVDFFNKDGEKSMEGERIHHAEYTFADGVSYVITGDEHFSLYDFPFHRQGPEVNETATKEAG